MSVEISEESIDDNIHHYDFTTASAWEIFIARIEELIYQWKLSTGRKKKTFRSAEFSKLEWKISKEEVFFADTCFTLSWHRGERCDEPEDCKLVDIIDEAMDYERDFAITPHVITFNYGLSEFVVLEPMNTSVSHSRLNILSSALVIAVTNAQCEVPFFVRALDLKQNFYVGVACNQTSRTHFDMVDLKKVPQQCQHLTGLTHIFKSNLKKNFNKDVFVSVRLSYQLKNWTSFIWCVEQPSIDYSDENIDKHFKLHIGCSSEPIAWMCIRATWSNLPEGSIVDGPGYSDLDPCQAPKWTVSIGSTESSISILAGNLFTFVNYCLFDVTNEQLIGDLLARHKAGDFDNALRSITESRIPKLSDLIFSDSMRRSFEEPIPKNHLFPILHYLFPDTDKNKKHPYTTDETVSSKKFKTCQEDSLIWRLAIAMSHVLNSMGGPKASAHLWHEFVQEIRFRWNSTTLIPGVAPGQPDIKTCLLHQKLQMINCCIQRKLEKERALLTNQPDPEESEDEFYDAQSDDFDGNRSISNLPAGRLEKHPTMRLLMSGNPLYVPKTQTTSPKTEDQMEEDDQATLNLGNSVDSFQILISEMESFKAANPGAVFEDFIRWHSPRDWIEKEDENGAIKGELSARMTVQDKANPWVEAWADAKPIPAHKQKRLFDETKEAEKAILLIETAGPAEAAAFLLPALIHAALDTLGPHVVPVNLANLSLAFDNVTKKAQNRTRINTIDLSAYLNLILEIQSIERVISQVKSLENKFGINCGDVNGQFIGDLVLGNSQEVEVPGGPNGLVATKIKLMFTEAYRVEQMLEKDTGDERDVEFSHVIRPDVKEFIIRVREGDIAQRLTATLTPARITMASLSTQPTLLC